MWSSSTAKDTKAATEMHFPTDPNHAFGIAIGAHLAF